MKKIIIKQIKNIGKGGLIYYIRIYVIKQSKNDVLENKKMKET